MRNSSHDPAQGRARVLIVIGGDNVLEGSKPGKVRFLGLSDVDRLLPESIPHKRLVLGKDLDRLLAMLRQRGGGGDLSAFDCVLNIISDADHNPNALQALHLLLRGYKGRVINRPEAVLRTARDAVSSVLAGIPGLLVPGVCRIRGGPHTNAALAAVRDAGLAFPLIIRRSATHMGRTMVVVETESQFRAAVSPDAEYYAIEFIDYRSPDGLYRKYRTWSFGGRQVFRHLAVTDDWNVHVTPGNDYMLNRPDLIDEERRLMERPEGDFPNAVHATIDEIGRRLDLDCWGLDYGFHPDGRLVLFEANATMSFFPLVKHKKFEFRRKVLAPSQDAFVAMLGLQD